MKTNFASVKRSTANLLAALLLGAGAAHSQAALALPPSPVFSNSVPAWDCLITGANGERGIALITFSYSPDGYGNYSFGLLQIHTKVASAPVASTTTLISGGGRGGSSSRGDVSTVLTNISGVVASAAGTNIYGYLGTSGSWGFDYKGNILGFFVELILDKPGEGTNPPTYFTNQVSFIAKVTPNKRLTALYSSSIGGNGKYSGVPQKTVTNKINGSDFSGPWTGNEILGPLSAVELFTLTAAGLPNTYNVTGDGPGYTLDWGPLGGNGPYFGKCLVSTQKKIAFANHKYTNPTNSSWNSLRATYGTLNNSSTVVGGKTKGLIQPGDKVSYDAFFVPFVPYP